MKAFPRAVYLNLAYFDHIHRFMPAMVRREGLEVRVVDVTHAQRHAGQSKYNNTRRALVGIVDLVGVAWLLRRRALPVVTEDAALRDGVSVVGAVPPEAAARMAVPKLPLTIAATLQGQPTAGKRRGAVIH